MGDEVSLAVELKMQREAKLLLLLLLFKQKSDVIYLMWSTRNRLISYT